MASYPPNFNDPGLIQFCTNAGQPANVDGFYAAINNATGNTNGSIDDVWKLYIINVLLKTYVGPHPSNYGLAFGDELEALLWGVTQTIGDIFTYIGFSAPSDSGGLTGYLSPIPTTDTVVGYSDMFAAKGCIQHITFPGSAAGKTGYGITLSSTDILKSAELSFTCGAIGSAITGIKIYAKKVNQDTLVGAGNDAYSWKAAGALTSAYVSHVPTSGINLVNVLPLITELQASPGWDSTDATVQFILESNTPYTSETSQALHGVVIQRRTAGAYNMTLRLTSKYNIPVFMSSVVSRMSDDITRVSNG